MAEARKTLLVRTLRGAGGADAILARPQLLQISKELSSRRCAKSDRSLLERCARRIQEARLPLGRGEVRTGGTIVLTIRRHAVDAPCPPVES